MMTLQKFLQEVEITLKRNRKLRPGQCMFNILNRENPKKALSIKETEMDPYFDNNNILNFIRDVFPNDYEDFITTEMGKLLKSNKK